MNDSPNAMMDRQRREEFPSHQVRREKNGKKENYISSGGLCGFHLRAPVRAPGPPGAPRVPETAGSQGDEQH